MLAFISTRMRRILVLDLWNEMFFFQVVKERTCSSLFLRANASFSVACSCFMFKLLGPVKF